MIREILIIVILVLISIEQGILIYKHLKPHGVLHIDEYRDKDVYRMLYFVPIEDLKKHRRLRLKVETQTWNELSGDFDASFMPEDY